MGMATEGRILRKQFGAVSWSTYTYHDPVEIAVRCNFPDGRKRRKRNQHLHNTTQGYWHHTTHKHGGSKEVDDRLRGNDG